MIWGYPHGLETSIYCFLAIHVHGNTSSCLALSWGFRTISPTNRCFPLWASMKFLGKNSVTFPMFQYQRHDIWGSQPTISGQSPMISWVQNKGPILQKLALQPRVTLLRRLRDVTSLKCWGFTILGFWIHHLLVDWTGLGRYGDESNKPLYIYIYIYIYILIQISYFGSMKVNIQFLYQWFWCSPRCKGLGVPSDGEVV